MSRFHLEHLAGDGRVRLFHAKGCADCRGTGFRGRLAIFELVALKGEILELVTAGASEAELRAALAAQDVDTLLTDGLRKALAGETTIEEVLRVSQLLSE